jgi:O-antigen ligase
MVLLNVGIISFVAAFVVLLFCFYLFYERVLCVMRILDFWLLLLLFLLFVAFLRVTIKGTENFYQHLSLVLHSTTQYYTVHSSTTQYTAVLDSATQCFAMLLRGGGEEVNRSRPFRAFS